MTGARSLPHVLDLERQAPSPGLLAAAPSPRVACKPSPRTEGRDASNDTEGVGPAAAIPSVRSLRVFEAVARLESVSKAARELHLSQPALTQTIAKLEAEVGKTLLDRRTTGTYLTGFGCRFQKRTWRFFEHIENAIAEINLPDDKANTLKKVFRVTRSQMRCHLMIVQSKSFAQAAAELGLAESSLHKAARDLEANVGVMLYRNSSGGLLPTPAAEVLARGFLLSIDEMRSAAEELVLSATAGNSVTVGAPMLEPAPFLAAVMEAFTRLNPDHSVKVVNSTFEDLRQRTRMGLLDLTIGVLKDEVPDLCTRPLFEDPYVVAARQGHPLCQRRFVGPEDLAAYDWIVLNPGSPRRRAFDQLFEKLDRKPRASIESHSHALIYATLCDSDRLTILPRSELLGNSGAKALARVRTLPLLPTPVIGLTTRANWLPTPSQQAFVDLLVRHASELAAPR